MCIRDRGYDIANEPQDGRVENGALNWPTLASVVAHDIRDIDANPVSYTHLDVYKRQVVQSVVHTTKRLQKLGV